MTYAVLPLFDNAQASIETPAAVSKGNPRASVIRALGVHTPDEFVVEYEKHILGYLGGHGIASAEEIRLDYEERFRWPATLTKRASGPIYKKLTDEKIIAPVEMELSKIYGNPIRKYRLVKGTTC